MSFPPTLTTRTVKGRFVTHPDGVAAIGSVRFALQNFMQGPTDDAFVAPFDITIPLDGNGAFSTVLPATNDPQWTASYYRVVVTTSNPPGWRGDVDRLLALRRDVEKSLQFRLDIPYDSNTPIDLADVANVPPATPGESYVLLASRGAPGGVASLGQDGKVPSNQLPPVGGDIIVAWDDVQDKPDTFPPGPLATSDITGLDTALASKASTTALTTGLAGKANTAHTHAQSDITGLSGALSAKADASSMSSALALKADSSSVASSLATKADLVGGVIPTAQLPAIAVIDFLGSVSTQGAMLALTGQKGDWCIRTDLGQAWVITGSDPTQLASWTSMPLAAVPVQTVNGQTGTVVLAKADVGLGNVNNTADTAKPVSTAQQAALDLKANIASPTFTGTVSGVTAAMVGLGNVTNTSDANKPVSTAQQTALNLKADLASPTLTGTPTAPTPAAGTNTTQVATTAFVQAAVSADTPKILVLGPSDSVPGGTPAGTIIVRTAS